ncbi:MAG: hypothetical protein KC535_04035, partial [Nanoarchaeota archaeon]|nr:hypothetical protein [Nanoarchaeota archaeon]
ALQFDQYFKIKPESKLQFYRKFNIPLNKKIITYTMTSSLHQPKEHEIIIIISEILRDYFPDCVLLVRGYPNNPNNGMFDSLSKKYSFFFDDPAKSEMVGEKYFPSKDYLRNLISTMKYSLCTINYPSTIILDASIFLKPTINLKFDTHEEKKGFSPAKRFYNYLHFRYVTESNASIVVNNKKELINGIRAILKNPDLKKNELLSFRDKICGPVDGKAYLRQRKILQQLSEKYLSLRSL